MKHLKNIIFDLGVVLLNIDYALTAASFRKLGVQDFEKQYSYEGQQQLYNDYEKGFLSKEEFCERLRGICALPLTDEQIASAWNSMLLDFPAEREALLARLGSRYRLFLLSNTNSMHVEAFTRSLREQFGYDIFEKHFEKAHFSSDIGMRKPDLEIFRHVLQSHGLEPEETLFIDDVQSNVDAARQVGIQAVLLKPGQDVIGLLNELTELHISTDEN